MYNKYYETLEHSTEIWHILTNPLVFKFILADQKDVCVVWVIVLVSSFFKCSKNYVF